jgi:hypothetical protein
MRREIISTSAMKSDGLHIALYFTSAAVSMLGVPLYETAPAMSRKKPPLSAMQRQGNERRVF